jgi:hypothetical protein
MHLPRPGTAEILTAEILALCVLTPRARPNSPAGSGFGPAEKHCAAQAEYSRLAAQAYSPSDAMSQARFCLDGEKKVQRRVRICRAICTLKRDLTVDVSAREGGRGPPDFPRRRRPRCIARCGGVVWLGGAARYILAMPAPIPGALDKAAAAAYGVSTARPAGPAAAPARAPGCGRGSRAV